MLDAQAERYAEALEKRLSAINAHLFEQSQQTEARLASRFSAIEELIANKGRPSGEQLDGDLSAIEDQLAAQRAMLGRVLESRAAEVELRFEAQSRFNAQFESALSMMDRRLPDAPGGDGLEARLQALESLLESQRGLVQSVLDSRLLAIEERIVAEAFNADRARIAVEAELSDLRSRLDGVIGQEAARQSQGLVALTEQLHLLSAQVHERLGPELDSRLRVWRDRLDNDIGMVLDRAKFEAALAQGDREAALRSEVAATARSLADQKSEVAKLSRILSNLKKSIERPAANLASVAKRQEIEPLQNGIVDTGSNPDEVLQNLSGRSDEVAEGLNAKSAPGIAEIDSTSEEVLQDSKGRLGDAVPVSDDHTEARIPDVAIASEEGVQDSL